MMQNRFFWLTCGLFIVLSLLTIASAVEEVLECPPSIYTPFPLPKIRRFQNGSAMRLYFENVTIPDGSAFYVKVASPAKERIVENGRLDSGTSAKVVVNKDSRHTIPPSASLSEEENLERTIMEYPKSVWKNGKFFRNFHFEIDSIDEPCRSITFHIDYETGDLLRIAKKNPSENTLSFLLTIWIGYLEGKDKDGNWIKKEYSSDIDFDIGGAQRVTENRVDL